MALFDLDPLLNAMLDTAPGISDLNLSVGRPPQVEIDGALRPVSYADIPKLMPYHTELVMLRRHIEAIEVRTLLSGEYDAREALLTIRSGSGGVDAADWAEFDTLEVFADVTCPFTYVGVRRLVAAREERGLAHARLRFRAWPLEIVNGVPLQADFVAHEIADIRAQVAPDLFAGFDPTVFPSTSIPAFGLAAAAYDRGDECGEFQSEALNRSIAGLGI
jgi:hypothetical protein